MVAVTPVCNDNGTPSDPSDDYVVFTLDFTGSANTGTAFTLTEAGGAAISQVSGDLTYANAGTSSFRLPNGSADGMSDFSITVTDNVDGGCTEVITIQDVASCSESFDLALRKTLAPASAPPFFAGSAVSFDITVFNQGTSTAFDIDVADYADATELDFVDFATLPTTTGNSNAVTITPGAGTPTFEISELAAGDLVTVTINFTIDAAFPGTSIINNAEITDASDSDGGTTATDEDSPLTDVNDGTTNELATNDDIDDEAPNSPGTEDNDLDEDDYDAEEITVSPIDPTISIADPCVCFDVEYDLPEVDPFEFTDSIEVVATPGQVWRVYDVTGVESIDSFVNRPFPLDTVLTEVIPGTYSMKFAHTANVGYTIFVTNTPVGSAPGTPGDSLSIGATCFQPEPFTPNLPFMELLCPEDQIALEGAANFNGTLLPGGSFTYDLILGDNPGDTLFNQTEITANQFTSGTTITVRGRYTPPTPPDPSINEGMGFCAQTFSQEVTFDDAVCATCDLTIAGVTPICNYNSADGQSSFSVQVDLSWDSDFLTTTPDVIEVTLDGMTMSTGALNTVTGTTSVTFTNVSGPAYGVPITAAFTNEPTCDANAFVDLIACTDPCVADGIGGNVFNDFNNDGADAGASDVGQANVRVEVYDCAGMLVCATWTDVDGNWSCAGLNDDEEYRVEFSTPLQDYLQPSAAGTDNGTNTQFVTAPSCDVDYGVISLSAYCDANPDLAIPCFVNGDPAATPVTGGVNTDDAFVQFSDASTGNTPIPIHNGSAAQLGTVWGSAVQASTGRLFTAAMLKRHSGLGPGGIDGIYVLEDGVNNSAALWLDGEINTDVSAAINPVSAVGAVPSNAGRGLGAKDQPNYDADVFPLIGKVGYGDLDISEDEKTLYVINLADRTLNLIDIASVDNGNPQITTVPIPDPGCNDGIARPWGLGVRDGIVYVGVVCTGELSGRTAGMTDPTTNLEAFVYAFRPGTGFNETPALEFSLDFDGVDGNADRGCTGSPDAGCRWFTWIDNFIDDNDDFYEQAFGGDVYIAPQPILSDIEFDSEGFMVLNFTDRNGHQLGWINFKPDPTETDATTIRTVTGGDLLIASPDAGGISWTLENNGSVGTRTSAGTGSGQTGEGGPNTNQGPGGGEFFFEDFLGGAHSELPAGSSAIIPGTNRLATATMDAIDFRSHGIRWYNTEDGAQLQAFTVFTGQTDTDFATTFGKAGGLGDLSYVCQALPIQIGNYVWIDEDEDGVQDPCEPSIEGVPVSLYNKETDLYEQATTTGPDGEYYFNDVTPNTDYVIVFGYDFNNPTADGSWDNTSNQFFIDGLPFELTVADAENAPLPLGPDANDLNDSDATLMNMANVIGYPMIRYMTADSTDHTLDVGLVPAALTSIGSTVFVDNNNNAMQDAGDMGIPNVELLIYQVVGAQDGNGNAETDDVLLDVGSDGDLATVSDGMNHITNAQGDYLFQSLPPGDYYIVIPDAQFGAGEALAINRVSSTDIGSTVGDNQTDSDDNGQQAGGAGTAVISSVINLAIGTEPTDVGFNPEDGQGAAQDNVGDNLIDENGDMTVDFGFFAPVCVGDYAYVDLDESGTQSIGDEALPGVTVTLYDSETMMPFAGTYVDGSTVDPLVTDGSGAYKFANLPPGDYYVVFDISTIENADLYDFTTPNVGDDADDSDATPTNPMDDTAPSGPTGPLTSGGEDLTLDVGIVCAITVEVADPFTICSTQPVDLLTDASVTPARLGGSWSTPDGTGTFFDAGGAPIAAAPYLLGTAASYQPSPADAQRGFVTLTLTSGDPGDLLPTSSCGPISSTVRIDVLKVDCGQFNWNGSNE